MDKVVAAHEKHANFYTVYIREAHPTDGWRMAWNDRFGIEAKQPKTFAQRADLADQCSSALQMRCPMLIDTIDDRAAKAYAAFPDRLYLIDSAGRVAYKSGRGPFGFKPRELERSLIMLLMDERLQAVENEKARDEDDRDADKKDADKKDAGKQGAEKQDR